jgi:hypothetical protein
MTDPMRLAVPIAPLIALLLAACTAAPGTTSSAATPLAEASATPTAATAAPTTKPTPSPASTIVESTTYTEDDEQIATLIRAGADEAIPQLKALNKSDPGKLEDLVLPLGDWITSQRAGVDALAPSSCTAPAVKLFLTGIDQYDAIRKKFLEWRDWGAQGHAFPVAAPGQAVKTFEAALAELEANCPE